MEALKGRQEAGRERLCFWRERVIEKGKDVGEGAFISNKVAGGAK